MPREEGEDELEPSSNGPTSWRFEPEPAKKREMRELPRLYPTQISPKTLNYVLNPKIHRSLYVRKPWNFAIFLKHRIQDLSRTLFRFDLSEPEAEIYPFF